MGFDLASQFALGFFAACFAGMALGWLVGRFARFEVALGIGMLVPGVVAAVFTARFALAAHELATSPTRTPGVVVAIEDRPLGSSGTTPVAVVEFAGAGGVRRAESGGGTSLRVGDRVVVVAGAVPPRFGVPGEMRNGAIAALLFATFPLTAAVFFLGSAWAGPPRAEARAAPPSRLVSAAGAAIVVGLLGGGAWAASGRPVEQGLLGAFGAASLGLWLLVAEGVRGRRGAQWVLNVGVLAVNFSVWTFALALLAR